MNDRLNTAEFLPGVPEDAFFTDIHIHKDRAFAVTREGVLYAWGSGRFGLLGNGACSDVDDPAEVEFFSKNALPVHTAFSNDYFAGALTHDGRFFMWGRYDPIEANQNAFLATRPLPTRRDETVDVWPTEVMAMSGLPIIAIYAECPQCLVVMVDDFSVYRIVHKSIVSDPRKAEKLWESAHAASALMQNLAATGPMKKKGGKSSKSAVVSILRRENNARFRRVAFT